MGRRMKALIAVLMALLMMAGACSCARKETKKEAPEGQSFAGELIDAQGDRLVVKDEDVAMVMYTTPDTEYDLQDEDELCVGDMVKVEYHKDEGRFIADSVVLDKHQNSTLVFGGEVTEIGKTYVTVQSESMTVVFNTDEDTRIEGDLTQGDAVTVTYEGNLSGNPLAKSIVVIQEQKEKLEKSLHGTVSETWKDSFIVSVDSAHACRIKLTKDTKITGDAKELRLGDEIHLVYTGDIEKDAVAVSIKITRGKTKYFIMDGVIVKAAKDKLVIQTSKKKYTFKIVNDTRIENKEYMKAGHKTTITYIGKLDKDPVAASIFCSRDTATGKDSKKQDKKDDKKKEDKKDEKKDDDKPDDPGEVVIEARGDIVDWDDPCVIKLDGGATVKLDIKDAKVSAGYVPQPGDQVIIRYDKTAMKLIEIQLEYRPVLDTNTVVIDEEDADAEAEAGDEASEDTEG